MRLRLFLLLLLGQSIMATSQGAPPASDPGPLPTFKVNVQLVPVRVVVRDARGQTVGDLGKGDFQLFDQGKAQTITQFSVEGAADRPADLSDQTAAKTGRQAASVSGRYTVLLFDDLHLERNDLLIAREAVDHYLNSLLPATERVAIYTTSGQKAVDFTSDRARLKRAVGQLEPHGRQTAFDCPDLSVYMADLIANEEDQDALAVATREALVCANGNGKFAKSVREIARSAAREKMEIGRAQAESWLRVLRTLVQGMSKAPGDRKIVVVSPGFFTTADQAEAEIVDLAVRGDVIVSALDPRGLLPATDITEAGGGRFDPKMADYRSLSELRDQAILAQFADATGGIFFHNNNDLDEGFKRVASRLDFSYVLAFSPQGVKFDGRFHKLRVAVSGNRQLTVQARAGYYAPKQKP